MPVCHGVLSHRSSLDTDRPFLLTARGLSPILCLWLFTLAAPPPVRAEHPPIFLLDNEAGEINPMTGENANVPFSTETTCGMCHDYEEITSGYHFQMGWEVIDDSFGDSLGRPWQISNGMMGKWCPMYHRQLAKKHNETADEIDLTVYDFVGVAVTSGSEHPCGACHPGGGGLQYDREGNRYDEHLSENPDLRHALDGDYYGSRWDASGVVEADCFLCHLEGYNFDDRSFQLRLGNYQWAAVAGSGIGAVHGAVKRGEAPTVVYNRRFFNEDGSISLDMSWPPPDENCVFCHGQSDARKRGFSWDDVFNPDVHNDQGVSCAACHPSGLDHQFAKGHARALQVANHLDGSVRTCEQCHQEGYLGASIAQHTKIRPSHLEGISCQACHIPRLNRAAALAYESTTGEQVFYTNPPEAGSFGARALWRPVYERAKDGKIYPYNSMLFIWWGNLETDGIIYPLWLREQAAAWARFADQVTDDNSDGKPEVNRREEIMAGLKALRESLNGNRRFSRVHPVLVKGGRTYDLDEHEQLRESEYELPPCVDYSISHNVAPSRQSLGNGGCGDCHAGEAHFFKGRRVVDLFDEAGQPVTIANGRFFGCDPAVFAINTFHQRILSPVVSILVILVVFLITVHYHSYGPKRMTFVPYSGEIKRFSLVERGIHLFRLISFVFLTVSGLIMAFNWSSWQQLLFRSPQQMLVIHIVTGIVFITTTVMGIVMWFRDALFASYDRDWVRRLGGYLGYKGKVPSGRFNAGQKMFYWYSAICGLLMSISGLILVFKPWFPLSWICATSTFHNLLGFILIAGVLAHAYLGTVANPGTWRVLVDGYVTKEWAEHHHPNWYQAVRDRDPTARHQSPTAAKDESSDLGNR